MITKNMLYEFYGKDCAHCITMAPRVAVLQQEGFDIKQLEVWDDKENAMLFETLNCDRCPGVPFFLNTDTDAFLCGEASEDDLRAWAEGGPHHAS